VIADAGYQSAALTEHLADHPGWELRIIKRPRPGFEIVGPNWIVERTFAWLGRHRRLSKDYEFRVQRSEALITIAASALMLKRIRDERGITVVWVEHIMGVLLSVVDRVVVLDHGAVIFEGTPQQAQRDERVAEVYLGPPESRAA